jgi:hypothetical protein
MILVFSIGWNPVYESLCTLGAKTKCPKSGEGRNTGMRNVSMSLEIEFLRDFLEEEFGREQDVRVRPVAPTGLKRSVDLPQDYDPSSGVLHTTRGVRVIARSREYFFPAEWVTSGNMAEVHRLVAEVRDYLG